VEPNEWNQSDTLSMVLVQLNQLHVFLPLVSEFRYEKGHTENMAHIKTQAVSESANHSQECNTTT